MARDTDEQQRVIREDRMRRGKEASTASARREKRAEDPYVPKTRRRRDPMIHGEGSQAHVDDSSQVVDPTPTHDYAGYADDGFVGYDRMEEERMYFQPPPQDEAEDEGVPEDVVADYMEAHNVIPEGEPEREPQPRRGSRVPRIPPYPAGEAPFPGGPQTTSLLSDYARHVANPLWVNHNNVSV
jgi:hypothetical protein